MTEQFTQAADVGMGSFYNYFQAGEELAPADKADSNRFAWWQK
ncbi:MULTISPECIES: hypothetical protein [unclassified Rhodococcus (in: high G+C Gram-positive bacteria)]|nr:MULTISPECIES: hypothetical protein [unclassified Rhodococcus (in: high G+C Gram-positive bacteria)]